MIIVTGAAGMIGSGVVWKLNEMGINDIIVVDKMRTQDKWLNLRKRDYYDWIDRDDLFDWLSDEKNAQKISGVIHMGACSATTEQDADYLMSNNFGYSKKLWEFCSIYKIPYVYASSAATYGDGSMGYDDDVSANELKKLLPLNKYGYSKKIFDDWALKQKSTPLRWYGLKFFNVYGPQEYHKGRMASMVMHSFNQFMENGEVKLFKSYKDGFKDGEQLRDFIYLKDVVDIITYLFFNKAAESGIYNVGTGKARTFMDLAMSTILAINPKSSKENIKLIPMPEDLRGKYQYFTAAKNIKLRRAGYNRTFYSLEEGVADYVKNYLNTSDKYL